VKMIKAIIFDIGGVMVKNTAHRVFERLAEKLGLDTEKVISFRLKHKFALATGKMSAEEFASLFQRKFKISKSILDVWKEAYDEIMPTNAKVLAMVKKLKKRYRLCLITNTNQLHFSRVKARGLDSHFDIVIASQDVGFAKPEKKIFEIALKRIGLPASECAFIDDKREHVEAARKLGFKAILFENNGKLVENLKKLGVAV